MQILLLVCTLICTLFQAQAHNCCYPSVECDASVSGDCNEMSEDCSTTGVRTYFNPRSITNDLTYRNSNTFFQRFRGDASCSFFTFDSTFLYQQNRKTKLFGRGFFGENPLYFAEQAAPFNSLNLGLGSQQPEGFGSLVRLSPKRAVFAWLPQLIFQSDHLCPGTWADCAFAVTIAKHQICLFEQQVTPGDISNEPSSVTEAFNKIGVFPAFKSHTGIDDIQLRVGYRIDYCEADMISFYFLGNIPTRRDFDDTKWFQPYVGSTSGGVGLGGMLNGTLWDCEFAGTECIFMAELKYLYSFSSKQRRQFDLKNGSLSRFLLVASERDPDNPITGAPYLRACATIKPHHTVEWWVAVHYTCDCWGFEVGYNLWYRSQEDLQLNTSPHMFHDLGIYDMTRCTHLTSHSTAKISDMFGEGTQDATFTRLSIKDININSASAKEALSSTFSGLITYSSSWCDYPMSFAFGARYELAPAHHHTSALENWGVFGKITVSC